MQYVLLLCRPRGRAVMVIFVVLIFYPVYSIKCLPDDEGKSFKDKAQCSKLCEKKEAIDDFFSCK